MELLRRPLACLLHWVNDLSMEVDHPAPQHQLMAPGCVQLVLMFLITDLLEQREPLLSGSPQVDADLQAN